jgi:hypothetical protein
VNEFDIRNKALYYFGKPLVKKLAREKKCAGGKRDGGEKPGGL